MKKIIIIMSVTFLLMIAAVNTANAQSIEVNSSNVSWDYYQTGIAFDTNGNGYVTASLSITPNSPSNTYSWGTVDHTGATSQIYPNLTNSPYAYLYIWTSQPGASIDVYCDVNGTRIYLRVIVY